MSGALASDAPRRKARLTLHGDDLQPALVTTPLAGIRVLDVSTVVAGPGCARYLADFGATVIKVERPDGGDSTRRMGFADPADPTGDSLFWKLLSRGKACVALDLKDDGGRATLLRLVAGAHVLVENLRPGGLEKLGLGPDVLLDRNPALVITRITGFGQDGPYSHRAGFATLAEAMSGFAGLNGEPDGGPLLPPIALTDEVTALAAAFATLAALRSGVGQVVDLNLLETMLQLMGPLPAHHAATGELQPRLGSGIAYSVPRGTWQCRDGRWVAVSTSAESVARRVLDLIGLGDDPELATFGGRMAHRERIDARLEEWIGARTSDEVLAAFEAAEAAAAPVYDMADVAADPHLQARGALVDVGGVRMQGLVARLSATPGEVRWAGRALGADQAVLDEADPWATLEAGT
ncbi:MAG: CoA transferase [Acidimicrobiia bacterium]|nr:CoA transferase [Acidimicrobiia bacterium]